MMRGAHLTKRERLRVFLKAIDALESMRWAHYWVCIYREKLYRESRYGRSIEDRMRVRQLAAESEAWRLAEMYGVDRIPLHGLKNRRAIEWHTPSWKEFPNAIEARRRRASARRSWWMRQQAEYAHLPEHTGRHVDFAKRWYEYWKVVDIALGTLRLKSWPLSDRDIARAVVLGKRR